MIWHPVKRSRTSQAVRPLVSLRGSEVVRIDSSWNDSDLERIEIRGKKLTVKFGNRHEAVGTDDIEALRFGQRTILPPTHESPKWISGNAMIALPNLSLHIVSEEDFWHLHVPRNESGGV